MTNYLRVFLAPQVTVGLAMLIGLAAVLTWWRRAHYPGWRRVGLFGFIVYVGMVLLATLFREQSTGSCPSCLADWYLGKLTTGDAGTDVALNLVLFVPPAFLATLLWGTPVRAVLVAAAGSLAIEVAQPLLGVGANDAVDLLANTTGAVLGALTAAVVLLVTDAVARRPIGARRAARVAIAAAATMAVVLGYPAWLADRRQAGAATDLETLFAGTTLSDYQAHRDHFWDNELGAFSAANAPLTQMGYRTDTVARERFAWTIWFTSRCVIAQWTPTGFTTLRLAGSDCTNDFHP